MLEHLRIILNNAAEITSKHTGCQLQGSNCESPREANPLTHYQFSFLSLYALAPESFSGGL